MTLLLGCANPTLSERWQKFLGNDYQLQLAVSPPALVAAMAKSDIKLVLLHRTLADLAFITSLKTPPWVVMADVPDDFEAVACYRAGAFGYTNAYIAEARLREVVRVALAGQVWIGQTMMSKIIRGAALVNITVAQDELAISGVSKREWEVALLVGKGLSNLEIANTLNVTERTVKAHIGSLFKKTGSKSRLQLALVVKRHLSG
jgi:two-component system, NarL family, nitrate/nitrite response regulator NarL